MATTALQKIWQGYHYLIDDLSDARTKNWWLMEGPGPTVTILASYLFFCAYAGPRYMKDRKPYQLKYPMMVYNVAQIIFSIFLTYRGIEFALTSNYKFQCQNIDYSEKGTRGAAAVWWYFIAKITELLDTVFFVLRKKNNQISFLHLYHHTLMPVVAWIGTKYTPGGQAIPEGTINAFIHIVMYTYYFLSGLGPKYQKYLWWKRHVTKIQLVQFAVVLYLNVTGIFAQNCNYPKILNVIVITNCIAFMYMFGSFYLKSYGDASKRKLNATENAKKDS